MNIMPRVVASESTVPMPEVVGDAVADPMWPARRTCDEVHPQQDINCLDGH